jgi:predicted DsbA family dithiol-disulfide isomerase/uncharacterized membrane protein
LRPAHWLLLLRLAALVALATSAALMADYVAPEPTFCGAGSGCAHVRASGWGHLPLPGLPEIPVPLLGIVGFSFVLGASLIPDAQRRARVTVPLAGVLALSGLALIFLQLFVIGHICVFCVVVDLCALVVGGAAMGLRGEGWEDSAREELTQTFIVDSAQLAAESQRLRGVWREDSRVYTPPNPLIAAARPLRVRLKSWAWAGLGVLAIAAPLGWIQVRPAAPVPSVIRELYEPGKINVVEFADFQCPHCRDLHFRLKEVLASYGDRVHFERRHVPLPMHPQAGEAARAAICAEAQGRGDALADHLFEAEDLTPGANRRAAERLGLDLGRFDACLAAPSTNARIAADIELLREAGFEGLPTTYVGGQRILGAERTEVFRDAMESAARGDDRVGVPAWAYLLLCGAVAAALVVFGRVRPPAAPEDIGRSGPSRGPRTRTGSDLLPKSR